MLGTVLRVEEQVKTAGTQVVPQAQLPQSVGFVKSITGWRRGGLMIRDATSGRWTVDSSAIALIELCQFWSPNFCGQR